VNVNIPAGPVNGLRVTRLGKRRYGETVIEKTDPRGRPYFWIGSTIPTGDAEEGTDILAIAEKSISMSPLHLDLTDYRSMEVLEEIARGLTPSPPGRGKG
jgi:5'-nucleotidase